MHEVNKAKTGGGKEMKRLLQRNMSLKACVHALYRRPATCSLVYGRRSFALPLTRMAEREPRFLSFF